MDITKDNICWSLMDEKPIPEKVQRFSAIVRYFFGLYGSQVCVDTKDIMQYLSSNEGEPFTGEEEKKYLGRDMVDMWAGESRFEGQTND